MFFSPIWICFCSGAGEEVDNGQEVYGVIVPGLGLRYTDPTDLDIILGDSGGFLPWLLV